MIILRITWVFRMSSATVGQGCPPVAGRRWFGDGGKDWHLELLLVIPERCAAEGSPKEQNKLLELICFL